MKIQINSIAALERLIGGDTAVEIEIRNSVVQEFAKRHLKAIANTEEIKQAVTAARTEMIAQATRELAAQLAKVETTHWGAVRNVQLIPEVHVRIREIVRALVQDQIVIAVDLAVKETKSDIEKTVTQRVEYVTADYVKTEVRRQLDAVKAKL